MLELRHISKKYNKIKILNDISISFRKKEFVCILGESGSGKTTFLNIIGLLDDDYTGNIYINNRNISILKNYLNDKLLRTKIGFVFQDYNLIEELTVYQNISLSLIIKGLEVKEELINKYLKKCNILYLKNKKVKILSGGEKQRVCIARALCFNPDIILLDEPTGALDKKNSELVLELLKDVFYDKLIIMVTHDKNIAKKYSTRMIIIKGGGILYDSNPYLLRNKSKLIIRKNKMKYLNNIKYSFSSIKKNKFRNILTMIAIMISIITISIVLFLSNGFKNKISSYSENTFNKYPLIITKKDNSSVKKNRVNRYNYTNDIYLDDSFITNLEKFLKDNRINYLIKYDNNFSINDMNENIMFNSYIDNTFIKNNYKLIKGKLPSDKFEILLKLNDDRVDGKLFDYLKINKNSANYDDFINKNIYLNDNKTVLTIVGIVESNNSLDFDQLMDNNSNLLYKKELDYLFNNKNKYAVYTYDKKDIVKTFLIQYKNIKYQDISYLIGNNINKIINNIQNILLVFSFISFLISLILIISITYTSSIERKKEIGILKSLGARKVDIRRLFINEMIIISIIATVISFIFLFIIIHFINIVLFNMTGIKNIIIYSNYVVFKVILLSIFIACLGSYGPALKCSNKSVIECLK